MGAAVRQAERKEKMRCNKVLLAMLVVAMLSAPAWAQPKTDSFYGTWEGDNWLLDGGGSGWNGGEWIYYDQDPVWPPLWNQWFYDDPPRDDRWTEISYFVDAVPMPDPAAMMSYGAVDVYLNWSTMDFPETGPGGLPPMPDQEQYIERAYVGTIFLEDGMAQEPVFGDYTIPDFNPEWVSIDIFVDAWQEIEMWWDPEFGPIIDIFPMQVDVSGDITHECIPEPATLGLVAMGALAVIRRRRGS